MVHKIVGVALLGLLAACSATRYVPQGSYLLSRTKVELHTADRAYAKNLSKSELADYIQQRPNRRFLGIGLYLGFYNITDTAKHNGWHRFWGQKIGQAPVVLDSALVAKTDREMEIYLDSRGYLNSTVSDTITVDKKRKATVTYRVHLRKPYRIASVRYRILDTYIEPIVLADTANRLLQRGELFERKDFEAERERITGLLRNRGFWGFNSSYIAYVADSTHGKQTVNVTLVLRQLQTQTPEGEVVLQNHPIYTIDQVSVLTDYQPTVSIENQVQNQGDTLHYKGVDLISRKKLALRPSIITDALGTQPGQRFDQRRIEQAYNAVRSLGYTANFLFTPAPEGDTIAYETNAYGQRTEHRQLRCVVQCTPTPRHSFSADFEASVTSAYYSLALTLGYGNRNLFRGAERFNLSFRGAYEFMVQSGRNNAYEFGATAAFNVPRFWLPISADKMREFKNAATQLSVSYNIQNRPYYRRSIVSAVYGYSWTLKNGARFVINPADINVVSVPWVDSAYLVSLQNIYLQNSYHSQLIAGLSASYYYTTNADWKKDGFTFRVSGDFNGNLIRGITSIFGQQESYMGEDYYELFGLRFAQYFRLMADVSQRINVGQRSQLAWRFLLAGGYAYGNSSILPFDRMFFAGGANSMRGWQVRTLGPGSVDYEPTEAYPNQMGDMRIEANFEYRVNVAGGFGMAFFLDCGNVWNNYDGAHPDAQFRFDTFYKQLALNTGVGLRYDAGYFLVRLDWGIKLHNPNLPEGQRWGTQIVLKDTALQFALGLPF